MKFGDKGIEALNSLCAKIHEPGMQQKKTYLDRLVTAVSSIIE